MAPGAPAHPAVTSAQWGQGEAQRLQQGDSAGLVVAEGESSRSLSRGLRGFREQGRFAEIPLPPESGLHRPQGAAVPWVWGAGWWPCSPAAPGTGEEAAAACPLSEAASTRASCGEEDSVTLAVVTAPRLSVGKDVSQPWFPEKGETDFHGPSAGSTQGVEKNIMILVKIIFCLYKKS